MITEFKTTFNELFNYSFNRLEFPINGIVENEVVISSLVNGALEKFTEYCKDKEYEYSIKSIKENLILIRVNLNRNLKAEI